MCTGILKYNIKPLAMMAQQDDSPSLSEQVPYSAAFRVAFFGIKGNAGQPLPPYQLLRHYVPIRRTDFACQDEASPGK